MIWDILGIVWEIFGLVVFALMVISAVLEGDKEQKKIFLLWALVILLAGIWEKLP